MAKKQKKIKNESLENTIAFRMPKRDIEVLHAAKIKLGCSMSELMRTIVRDALNIEFSNEN